MKKLIVYTGAFVASVSVSAAAFALCVELTNYRPWDPIWIGAAIQASTTGSHGALRVLSHGGAPGARFRSDTAAGVEAISNAARSAILVTAESSTGNTTGVYAESSAPDGPVVQLLGGTSGNLIEGVSAGSEVFRIESNGAVRVRGQPILQKGPTGSPGKDGADGNPGAPGGAGADDGITKYVACVSQDCRNVCLHGVDFSRDAPCTVNNGFGATCSQSNEGSCCICKKP